MILKKKENEMKDLMSKVMENHRKYSQEQHKLIQGEGMPVDGGYGVHVDTRTHAQKEIEKLNKIIQGDEDTKGFVPAITTATSNYPLTQMKPGQIPEKSVLVFERLPKKSVILKLRPPLAPILGTKYIVLFYSLLPYKSRWGKSVYAPNYLLVPKKFGISVKGRKVLKETIPVFIPVDGKWGKAKKVMYKTGKVALKYEKLCFDRSILRLPKKEKDAFISQKDFNLIIWKTNRPPHDDHLMLKRNQREIYSLLDKLEGKIHAHKKQKKKNENEDKKSEKLKTKIKHK